MNPRKLLLLAALTACGGGSQPGQTSPLARQSCSGNAFVSVINDWDRTVEIYAVNSGSVRGQLLGTVLPGSTSEFLLPSDAISASAATPGLTEPVPVPSRSRSLVRLRYLCR